MRTKDAHWIRHTHLFRRDAYECFACGCRAEKPWKTCPRCGLPMKGSKYDPSWVDEMEAADAVFHD